MITIVVGAALGALAERERRWALRPQRGRRIELGDQRREGGDHLGIVVVRVASAASRFVGWGGKDTVP